MLLRTHLSGLAIAALSLAAAAGAGHAAIQSHLPGTPVHDGRNHLPAPVILAQASDPRLIGLEEEIRRLNGRLEDLNFQMLQMQDQLRRMQEDYEFRFQELEGRRSDAGASPPARNAGQAAPSAPAGTGEPPRALGTITLDESGNVVANGSNGTVDLLDGNPVPGGAGSVVTALPPSDNPEEIYGNAYQFVLSGDYRTAEAGFRQYLERFPNGEHAADASFWLGEALLGQDRYREAAEVFLQANRDHPSAAKAPEMLLKLGVSLAALDQIDVACATFTEVGQRYPQISDALRERVRREQANAGC